MCRRSRKIISESRRWGRRSCKQLSELVIEWKSLFPNSDLRTERGCAPAYAHAESYGISHTIWWMILRALFWSRKVMEFRRTIFHASKVMENSEGHGKSWKMMIRHVIFTTALSSSVKVTQIMNRNVILLTEFALVYLLTNFLQLWSLEMVCIHKLYIIYFEISVLPIGHGFTFFGHGKVMKNRCWKREGTLYQLSKLRLFTSISVDLCMCAVHNVPSRPSCLHRHTSGKPVEQLAYPHAPSLPISANMSRTWQECTTC